MTKLSGSSIYNSEILLIFKYGNTIFDSSEFMNSIPYTKIPFNNLLLKFVQV